MAIRDHHVRRRRERLSHLELGSDAAVRQERQEAVRALLRTPLLTPGHEGFGPVRRHAEWLRVWFAHHPGWQLDVTAEAARLRKTPPDQADGSRPCRDPLNGSPLSRRGYVYLCLAMASLVRADRQTALGTLAKEVSSHLAAEPRFAEVGIRTALENRDERRELVGAIRLLLHWNVLVRVQGDEDRFLRDAAADVLYNVNRPVLGRILAASRPPSLVEADGFEARLESTADARPLDSEEARHRRWRTRFFRRLLDDPVVYYDALDPEERAYLDRQRASILTEIEKATGLIREVRAEGIAMVDPGHDLTDYRLPEEGTEGHLTLLIAEHLAGLARDSSGETSVSLPALVEFTAGCIREHRKHWRKSVAEPGEDRALTEMVVARLTALSLARLEGDRVIPLPALGRYRLREPEIEPGREGNAEQAGLFG